MYILFWNFDEGVSYKGAVAMYLSHMRSLTMSDLNLSHTHTTFHLISYGVTISSTEYEKSYQ